MGFFHQLHILLWKNFTLRKRQPVRVIVEIVWPLCLFLILVAVRMRPDIKDKRAECHYNPRAMPSAGTIPFVQSYVCELYNECNNNISAKNGIIDTFDSTLFEMAFTDLEKVLASSSDLDLITNLGQDLELVNELVTALTNQPDLLGDFMLSNSVINFNELNALVANQSIGLGPGALNALENANLTFEKLITNPNPETFALINTLITGGNATSQLVEGVCDQQLLLDLFVFTNQSAAEDLQSQVCNLTAANLTLLIEDIRSTTNTAAVSAEVLDLFQRVTGQVPSADLSRVLQIIQDVQQLSSLALVFENLQSSLNQTFADLQNVQDVNTGLAAIGRAFCGGERKLFTPEDEDKKKDESNSNKNSVTSVTSNVNSDTMTRSLARYLEANVSSDCANFYATLESNSALSFFWSKIKPIVLGVIPYTPDSPATRKIIKEASRTFESITAGLDLLEDIDVLLPDIELLLDEYSTFLGPLLFGNDALSPENVATLKNGTKSIMNALNYTTALKSCVELNKFIPYPDQESLVKASWKRMENNTFWAAIIFNTIGANDVDLPTTVKYSIRMDTDNIDKTKKIKDKYWRPGGRGRPFIDTKYFTFGFIYIQDMIDHAIIRLQTNETQELGVYTHQFPYPCWTYDKFVFAISRSLPLFMVISWIYSVAMIVKGIVYEKEMRLKEVMKMMGLGNGVHWLAWFINAFAVMFITVILFCIILKGGKVLEYSDPSVIFVFMLAFTVSTISQCFLISVFFNKANLAAVCGGFIFFVLYLPYTQLVQWEDEISTTDKIVASLSSNIAMGYGCSYLALFEEQAIGAQWGNLGESPLVDDDFSLRGCILMMFLDTCIYLLLTWYIEAVFPGQYGIPRKWYFPVQKSYWLGKSDKTKLGKADNEMPIDDLRNNSPNFEPDPQDRLAGVKVQNLRKVYSGKKLAVDGLSINFYEGQITSFLGHNGAGKTTTMSILTGLFPPTSGTAYIYGKNIMTATDEIRSNLGMCPQHNILFDLLTVEEHIWFYARLKGRSSSEVKDEMNQMIKNIGLPHKRKEKSQNLSGGMKRKLSVAIAFVGGSKTVILDEPTAGVDPYARRAIWEFLLKLKKGRTIILSTHHMDEADVLGDRIAIISQGKLCTVGSSLFLKNRFGTGYYLTLVRQDDDDACSMYSDAASMSSRPSTTTSIRTVLDVKATIETEDEGYDEKSSDGDYPIPLPKLMKGKGLIGFSLPKLSAFIRQFVPNAALVEDNSMEVCFRLPEEEDYAVKFGKLFEALERSHAEMGISSYGISDTSLEEVFLKVADDNWVDDGADERKRTRLEEGSENGRYPRPVSKLSFRKKKKTSVFNFSFQNTASVSQERLNEEEDAESLAPEEAEGSTNDDINFSGAGQLEVTGRVLLGRQLVALFIKRFHHVRRSKKGFISEIILPAGFVCLAMIFSLILPPFSEMPPLELQPWMYEPKTGSNSLKVFYSNESPLNARAQSLEAEFLQSPNYGTRCMSVDQHSIGDKPCLPSSSINSVWTHVKGNASLTSPSCSCDTGFQRCPGGAGGPVPSHRGLQTNDHLFNLTSRNISDWLVKTNDDYLKRRYGGFSFGVENPLGSLNVSQVSNVVDRLVRAANSNQSIFSGTEQLWKDFEAFMKSAFVQDNTKAWFNNKGWTASVSYMNGLNNLILRNSLPAGVDHSDYGIVTINHPMNFSKSQLDEEALASSAADLVVAICVIFAMSFVPASFVLFLIEERVSNSKHLQFVSGINPTVYWMANSIWDYMNYAVPGFLCIIIFLAFGNEAYTSSRNFPCLLALLLLYGWSIIPMMHPFSRLFDVPSSAFVALSCLNVFIGTIATLATFILEVLSQDDPDLADINAILKQVFLVFPHYCLGRGLLDLASYQVRSEIMSQIGRPFEYNPFDWTIVGRNLFAMSMMGIFFVILNLLIEYKFFLTWLCISKAAVSKSKADDVDVAREKQRVLSGGAANDILRLEGLTKVYWTPGKRGKLTAVDNVSVGVPKGQCFGLLGVNGAGKTTTFKMLTGDISVSDGDAFVNQYSIRKNMVKVCRRMGYCPQFDALDPLITGREHLEFYARIRGIPADQIKPVADWAIRKLGLLQYADKISSSYSGGNKRKLSTAIAIIGNPPLIFLDEPTTGMDPKARRFLWNCINNIVKSGRSVILTSHSMEECEALCSRLAIMVNGSFQCIGSIQHLKNRFGNGYTIVLRVDGQNPDLAPVMEFIASRFPSAKLREKHHNMVQYQLGTDGLSLSQLFYSMEKAKQMFGIEDYSVSQTTLDQVFINFAKKQTDMLDDELDEEADAEDAFDDNIDNLSCIYNPDTLSTAEPSEMDEQSLVGSTVGLIRSGSGQNQNQTQITHSNGNGRKPLDRTLSDVSVV